MSETTRCALGAILDNSIAIHVNFAGQGGHHGFGIENMKLRLVLGKSYVTCVGICV